MIDATAQSKLSAHPGPLAGMRVLELAQIMAGPTCGMMLADMGADVVKIEKLPGGDERAAIASRASTACRAVPDHEPQQAWAGA